VEIRPTVAGRNVGNAPRAQFTGELGWVKGQLPASKRIKLLADAAQAERREWESAN
jgi:hypothetical protein